MGLDLESTLLETGLERDRSGPAEQNRQVAGKGDPEALNRTLRQSQVHEYQAPVRVEHTVHLLEGWQELAGGEYVDEVTGEYSVEGRVGKGKGRGTGLVEAVSGMRNEFEPLPSMPQHRGRQVHPVRPSVGIGAGKRAERETGSRAYVENPLSILHLKPRAPQCPCLIGDVRDQAVVQWGKGGVRGTEGGAGSTGCTKKGRHNEQRKSGRAVEPAVC